MMEGHRLAIRILGIAPTSHGFAFALTETPDRLLDWARCDLKPAEKPRTRIDKLIRLTRPLFVASEIERNSKRSVRARELNAALKAVCGRHHIMILCVERRYVYKPGRGNRPVTNHEIAEAAAARFPIIANKLPRNRRLWDGSDDRIGILLAAAVATAGWNHFQKHS